MAKQTLVTDDLDGSPDASTVRFSIDGRTFEIDLAAKSRTKLDKALEPFTAKATEVHALVVASGGNGHKAGAGRKRNRAGATSDDKLARAWGLATGHPKAAARARLNPEVRSAWEAAGRPDPGQASLPV